MILTNEKMPVANRIVKRGEVYHANLDGSLGHEQKNDKDTERRSVLVVLVKQARQVINSLLDHL